MSATDSQNSITQIVTQLYNTHPLSLTLSLCFDIEWASNGQQCK